MTGRPADTDRSTPARGTPARGTPARGGPVPGGPASGAPVPGAPASRGLLRRLMGGLVFTGEHQTAHQHGRPAAGDGPATRGTGAADPAVRQRARRYRLAFFVLAACGLVAGVAWALLGSRFLVVRTIEVTGTHLVPRSEVLAAAAIPKGLPLARLDTGAVTSRVERITQVQSAQVTRSWPDGVVIAIQERHAALAVPIPGGFDLIDASGVVVQQVKKQPRGMPRFTPVGPVRGNPGVRAAATVLRQLPAGIAGRVKSVTVPTADAVTLHLSGGITVDWGSTGRSAQKARELAILMHTHARIFNVSAPGTAVTG